MGQRYYIRKGETPDPEYLTRKAIQAEKEDKIRLKLFPERTGFEIEHEQGGYYYAPKVVRGCVCHRKPVVVLAIDRKSPLDPDYVPRWICICRNCFVRTEDHRSPEAATNAWNHGIVTQLSRLLHKKVELSRDGVANLLNAIGKQAGDELVGYYRTQRKLEESDGDHYAEKKSVRGHIQDLEGFFRESFYFDGLDREYIIAGLKKRGELDSDPVTSIEEKRRKAREKYHEKKYGKRREETDDQ